MKRDSERERERETVSVCIYRYIYIYVSICPLCQLIDVIHTVVLSAHWLEILLGWEQWVLPLRTMFCSLVCGVRACACRRSMFLVIFLSFFCSYFWAEKRKKRKKKKKNSQDRKFKDEINNKIKNVYIVCRRSLFTFFYFKIYKFILKYSKQFVC